MPIYIIRHAEPDYARDSLTEKGWREAALLSHRLAKIPDASYYVSPLGRARDTASLTLKAVGNTAEKFAQSALYRCHKFRKTLFSVFFQRLKVGYLVAVNVIGHTARKLTEFATVF